MKLGDLIKEYRDTHGLSQRQFANQCDLSNGYISILEKGINPSTGKPVTPTIPQLKKIADGLGLTLSDLFDMADDMPIDIGANPVEMPSDRKTDSNEENKEKLPLKDDESYLLETYRKLTPQGKEYVLQTIDMAARVYIKQDSVSNLEEQNG